MSCTVSILEHIEDHLTYLIEVTKGWVTTLTIKKQRYLKIRKEVDVKAIFKILKEKQSVLLES